MRTLIFIAALINLHCTSSVKKSNHLSKGFNQTRSLDSLELFGETLYVRETSSEKGDSFNISCYSKDRVYLNVFNQTLSGYIKFQDINDDSIPEIIIDDCFADEFGGLTIYRLDAILNKFRPISGTNTFSTDFSKISRKNLFYDQFCDNRNGCQSRLFKIVDDSAIGLAEIVLPFDENLIIYSEPIGSTNGTVFPISSRSNDNLDTIMFEFWSRNKIAERFR